MKTHQAVQTEVHVLVQYFLEILMKVCTSNVNTATTSLHNNNYMYFALKADL